jgi:quercetin dioxygenase-like cupin family protein
MSAQNAGDPAARSAAATAGGAEAGSAPAAGYQSSPWPTFDHPVAIPRSATTRHVWGDEESGEVLDEIYVSSGKIHQLLFELPPSGQFTHSPPFRTVFGADEVLYVVAGTVAFAEPETGEVVRAESGEALYFGPGTWHHAFNWASCPAHVLEFFAPPPATGTSGTYAAQHPLLANPRYRDDSALGEHIPGTAQARPPRRLTIVRDTDYRWQIDGPGAVVLSGVIVSTPHLTVARNEVRGHSWSGWLSHSGGASGYVLSGVLALRVSSGTGRGWHRLMPGDGFYIPEGSRYQVRNLAAANAVYLAGRHRPTARHHD